MTPRVVYDTNVVVSALLKENSNPALLIRLALNGSILPCLSQLVLDEYEEVLKRPKFSFHPATVDQFLRDWRNRALLVARHAASMSPSMRRTTVFWNVRTPREQSIW